MKLTKAFIGLLGLATPSIKADGNPSDELEFEPLIEWDDAYEKGGDSEPQGIYGGEYIEPGSRPWLVPVVGKYFCGGSLISPSAVMTAAHCVVSQRNDYWHPPSWVDFNRYTWYSSAGVRRVYIRDRSQCDGDVVYHPYYNDTALWDYDVAIVFLPRPITDVMPVQLNEDKKVPEAGELLDAVGWGRYRQGWPSLNRRGPAAVNLTYVGDNEVCTKKPYRWGYYGGIRDSQMCAIGDEAPKATCNGDSGGPINLLKPDGGPSNTQVGIVSYGIGGCYHRAYPNVFTRVSMIADWVKETVCFRKGELCEGKQQAKAGKITKMKKKYPDTCVPVGTDAPTTPFPSDSPTLSLKPSTETANPTSPWPTWYPTETANPTSPQPTWYPTVTLQPTTPAPTEFPTWMPTQAAKGGKESLME